MTLTRTRKARFLEKAGLRYVAGWLPEADAADVAAKIVAAEPAVDAALAPARDTANRKQAGEPQ